VLAVYVHELELKVAHPVLVCGGVWRRWVACGGVWRRRRRRSGAGQSQQASGWQGVSAGRAAHASVLAGCVWRGGGGRATRRATAVVVREGTRVLLLP
jgi:hypothetical protein